MDPTIDVPNAPSSYFHSTTFNNICIFSFTLFWLEARHDKFVVRIVLLSQYRYV